MSIQLSFIGGGGMGEALLSRLLARGLYEKERGFVGDRAPHRFSQLQQQKGGRGRQGNREGL
ncbi:MAG: NAD(P)-binding domain-containing protein, partial [Jaaginema sp. PMC 1079.18]|nr:NAD(P)-binding domain-containing protein [Jaaginema sp. PMC 1079.18]